MKKLEFRPSRTSFTLVLAAASALVFSTSAKAQLSLDTSRRENSRVFFNAIYPASESPAIGWTGNVATGVAGTTSVAFRNAVLLRVNFFRALAGLPAEVSEKADFSSGAQSAALMMSANAALNHAPPTTWKFYSVAGANAAGRSNLAYGFNGSAAISKYIEESGTNNEAVGHRRWILYPQTQQMGTGDIPASGTYAATNALWIFDTEHFSDVRPTVRSTFVAWPPEGFVPYQFIYPRWSFSYPNADFTSAQVSLQRNGTNIPVQIGSRDQGYGENSIVFIPNNLNPNNWTGPVAPASDSTSTVTVSNVVIDGAEQSFSYSVTSFDPAKTGSDTPDFTITGAATPTRDIANVYSVADQVLATGYQWKSSKKAPYNVVDGAETAGTVATYNYVLRDKAAKAAGAYSYHLANPRFIASYFSLKTPILCSASTVINFASRLTYATTSQYAKVEVSTDGGKQWSAVWTQRGTNRAGEAGFSVRHVSLAAYAGKEVQVRFKYDVTPGSVFTQTSTGVGWYVDNVWFTSAEKLIETQMSDVTSAPTFSLVPAAGISYAIQVRTQVYGQYFLDWSTAKTVKASN